MNNYSTSSRLQTGMVILSSRDQTTNEKSTIISHEERKYGNLKRIEAVNKSLTRLA